MLDVTLEQLATLVALDEHGTFEAAAKSLHVTASAVSQRVRAAELAIGQVLVQRTNPVAITNAGATVLRYARQVQLLQRDAEHELRLDSSAGVPSIGIAVNADSLNTWFLVALAPLASSVTFDLHREDQENTTALLRAGTVVAAVTSTSEPVQGCSSVPLGIMRYRAVCTPEFASRQLAGRALKSALMDSPAVIFDRSDELQDRFASAITGEAITPPRHYVPASADFAAAVRLGFGWGMLPESQCADELTAGSLVELAPESPLDIRLFWQRWNLATPLLDAISDAVLRGAALGLIL
ncbi:MAG TPA: LysR family transcriptional regulator ArgP [Galbitalea sp.]|jgi:LysR family transcriptional regulator (chromosome initiation inhibitor)|nr:LysR family transcriptional regulator ArgP [Galbitalea sp.]